MVKWVDDQICISSKDRMSEDSFFSFFLNGDNHILDLIQMKLIKYEMNPMKKMIHKSNLNTNTTDSDIKAM